MANGACYLVVLYLLLDPFVVRQHARKVALIKHYFHDGYGYSTMLILLGVRHGVSLSMRQLKRVLRKCGLRRRTRASFGHLQRVECLIRDELLGSSGSLGYRALWHRLRLRNRLPIARNVVMRLLRLISPEEVESRRRHRLKRRTFYVKGPNEIWSIDGYDKLKQFGFAIHGCIDAYSRRIMWLKTCVTNNNPKVVAFYYLRAVEQIQGAPRLLRADCGTENSVVSFLQPYLCQDVNSFRFGSSVSNQRIEAFWSILRRWCTNWWINLFQGLLMEGLFEDTNVIHRDCLRFCFTHLVQSDLDAIIHLWNTHRLRRGMNNFGGIPDELYMLPFLNGTHDYAQLVHPSSLTYAKQYASIPPPPVSLEFLRAAIVIMNGHNIRNMPTSISDALHLYFLLVATLELYI